MLSTIVQATATSELIARLEAEAARLATAPVTSDEYRRALRWHEAVRAELYYRGVRKPAPVTA